MAIKTTSATAIPMIFRLIDSRIMLNALPQPPRVHKHIRDVAGVISAIDGRPIATEGVAVLTEHWHHVGLMRRVLLRMRFDQGPMHVRLWRHIATFRCAAEFDRYRGIADIEQAAPGSSGVFPNPPKDGTTYWRPSPRWIFNLGERHDDPAPRLALERIAPGAAVPRGKGPQL